jgi:hypothetical protein
VALLDHELLVGKKLDPVEEAHDGVVQHMRRCAIGSYAVRPLVDKHQFLCDRLLYLSEIRGLLPLGCHHASS